MVDLMPSEFAKKTKRRRINLAVVLDVGQSMNRTFANDMTDKLEKSKEVLVELLREVLTEEDRFALVWFDDIAKVFQPMVEVGKRNLTELCRAIQSEIRHNANPMGSTRVDFAGFELAIQEFRKLGAKNKGALEDAENRVLIISALSLKEQTMVKIKEAASSQKEPSQRVYCSVCCNRNDRDLNWDVVQRQRERMYSIAGANFFTLNSSEQLRDRIISRFEETVTPLLFNLTVTVEVPSSATTRCVDAVHRLNDDTADRVPAPHRFGQPAVGGSGSESVDGQRPTNQILEIRTLFLSQKPWDEEGHNFVYNHRENRHRLLVALCFDGDSAQQSDFKIVQRFESSGGDLECAQSTVTLSRSQLESSHCDDFKESAPAESNKKSLTEPLMANASISEKLGASDYFDNGSIRKAVLLSRYLRILREWAAESESDRAVKRGAANKLVAAKSNSGLRGGSIVSAEWQHRFRDFAAYFEAEAKAVGDEQLDRELNVLRQLCDRRQ